MVGDEAPDAPLTVAAHPERSAAARPAAAVAIAGPGPFGIDVPAGTWWLRAAADAPAGVAGWAADAVTVDAGARIEGVLIEVEVPDRVR